MKDLPLHGGAFTWAGGPGNQRLARLDRFLIYDDWENYFESVDQRIMPKPLLDYFPILLIAGDSLVRRPMPFRFENMWLKAGDFSNLVDGLWKSFEVRRTSSFMVAEKLKALKLELKCWNKEVFWEG